MYNTIFFCFYSTINPRASTGLPNYNLLRNISQRRLLFQKYSRSSVSDLFPRHFPREYLERLGRRQNPTLTTFSIDIRRPLIQILLLAFLLLLLSPLYRIGDSASPCFNLAVTTFKISDRRFTMLSNSYSSYTSLTTKIGFFGNSRHINSSLFTDVITGFTDRAFNMYTTLQNHTLLKTFCCSFWHQIGDTWTPRLGILSG